VHLQNEALPIRPHPVSLYGIQYLLLREIPPQSFADVRLLWRGYEFPDVVAYDLALRESDEPASGIVDADDPALQIEFVAGDGRVGNMFERMFPSCLGSGRHKSSNFTYIARNREGFL
jgi:hypothetical protein